MNQATFNAIVGKKKGVSPLTKDSDGDKVINMLDCKPNDPNKQGWIHNVSAAIAEKVGATKTAESIRERGEQVDETRELAKQERYKQEKETAVYREQVRAEVQRKNIKERANRPSGMGSFLGSFNQAPQRQSQSVRSSPTGRRKVVTYVKKGKNYVKKTSYRKVKVASAPRQNLQDKNRDGIPDILGVSLGASPRKSKAKPFRMF